MNVLVCLMPTSYNCLVDAPSKKSIMLLQQPHRATLWVPSRPPSNPPPFKNCLHLCTASTSSSSRYVIQDASITLTTQCSLDRWLRFAQQAESWGGPVSVAVYIPAPERTV